MARNSNDPVKASARQSQAQRRVGDDAACSCGENRAEALIAGRKETICYACAAARRGKRTVESHHVAGRANSSVTLDVPINDHRADLSIDQCEWPAKTLRNPGGSGLLASAARIRGFVNTVSYLMRELLDPVPGVLEDIDAQGRESRGERDD